ncbi:MAG: DUF5320 domain-containing protein [Candidatus Omnitrophica bacterium]|nr:DUF5320 domain-containing protein [Candidatus Omnitrophota bacterium]
MPRFDGTGPRGQGSFTGGGRGYCVMSMSGVRRSTRGGSGRGRGFGRGQSFRGALSPYSDSYWGNSVTPQNEAEILRDQVSFLQEELNVINARLKKLDSSLGSQEDK